MFAQFLSGKKKKKYIKKKFKTARAKSSLQFQKYFIIQKYET